MKLQLCITMSALICDRQLEASTWVLPLCSFHVSVSLFSLPYSMERGLQQHHSNYVSAEIHLSALSLSNISVLLPSGKIKYLVLRNEIHSKVLSRLRNSCKGFFFPSKANYFTSDQRHLFIIYRGWAECSGTSCTHTHTCCYSFLLAHWIIFMHTNTIVVNFFF